MGEDDIMELLWKSGQVVPSSQTQTPPTSEGNAQPPLHHHNLFIHEDEMASWLQYQDYFCSGVASTHPQISSLSLAPPQPSNAPTRAENYMNLSALRGLDESMHVGSSTFPATESYLTAATETGATTFMSRVSSTFVVPSRDRKDKAVAIQTVCEIAGTSSSCTETEPVQIQPAIETEISDDRKQKESEETFAAIQGTEEARGSTSKKRSRVAEVHNLAEKRRREKINDKMKTLQELIPHCNKNDKASMLDDVIEHVKTLQIQVQMMSMGYGPYGVMPPMIYEANTQRFIPNMAVGMNRPPPFVPFPGTPFPREAHMAGVSPSYPAPRYPFPNIQASAPYRVPLPSLQPGSNPVLNQPQFAAYMHPYSQFVGLHQMQQPPPPLQSQTASQLSFSQASSSKEHEDQDNQPTG